MKKLGYCPNCRLEFEYNINNMEEYNNVFCPKCNNRVSNNYSRPKQLKKSDQVAGSIFSWILKFYFYFYLITSCIGLTFYFLGSIGLFKGFITAALVLYLIELMLGYTRNVFGLFGMIISITIFSFIFNDIVMGIYLGACTIFILSGLLRLLFIFILMKIDKRISKKN